MGFRKYNNRFVQALYAMLSDFYKFFTNMSSIDFAKNNITILIKGIISLALILVLWINYDLLNLSKTAYERSLYTDYIYITLFFIFLYYLFYVITVPPKSKSVTTEEDNNQNISLMINSEDQVES